MRSLSFTLMLMWVTLMTYTVVEYGKKDEEFRILIVLLIALGLMIVFGWFDGRFPMRDKSDD